MHHRWTTMRWSKFDDITASRITKPTVIFMTNLIVAPAKPIVKCYLDHNIYQCSSLEVRKEHRFYPSLRIKYKLIHYYDGHIVAIQIYINSLNRIQQKYRKPHPVSVKFSALCVILVGYPEDLCTYCTILLSIAQGYAVLFVIVGIWWHNRMKFRYLYKATDARYNFVVWWTYQLPYLFTYISDNVVYLFDILCSRDQVYLYSEYYGKPLAYLCLYTYRWYICDKHFVYIYKYICSACTLT